MPSICRKLSELLPREILNCWGKNFLSLPSSPIWDAALASRLVMALRFVESYGAATHAAQRLFDKTAQKIRGGHCGDHGNYRAER